MTPSTQISFGGLVVGSTDPQRLAAWYRAAFAQDGEPGDILGRPVIVVGGARLVFDKRPDLGATPVEPGRVLTNLYVADVDALETHLRSLNVRWVRPLETVSGFGAIATLADADGNLIQLLQPERG